MAFESFHWVISSNINLLFLKSECPTFLYFQVLVELLGNNEEAKKWLQVNHNHVAAKEDILQHFWSQISKEDIKGVYQKYKVDFEIFGYSPDWYIQLGKE